jgi:hypothetical protein|tara:strand:+ start:1358 stop:1525 length:168 start_codon:yes stop_codon:yes gene_type:complete
MEDNTNFETLIADIYIDIVDEFVELGLIRESVDVEQYFKDAIRDVLHRYQANFKY